MYTWCWALFQEEKEPELMLMFYLGLKNLISNVEFLPYRAPVRQGKHLFQN